jgi:tripartite-type tricarboxylate transporter receptor subunit TctC
MAALKLAGLVVTALMINSQMAHSQTTYPTRPVRIVVPSAAGGAGDTVARVIAQPLSERIGQPVLVDARPGAGGIVGTEVVAKSAADGHTLLLSLPAVTINQSVYKTLPYDALRDFAAITQATSQPNMFVVHPSLPAKSVKELIALAKARPGELAFASSGTGTSSHLTVELFLLMSGTRMLHVPYKGPTPGVIDLVAGRVALAAPSTIATIAHVRAGRLRAIGITTLKRIAALPEIPTVSEAGVPGYESVSWYGLATPTGTPKDVIARLYKETAAILRTTEMKDRFARDGTEVVATSPDEFATYMRSEVAKWAKVVKSAGIKPE